MKQKLLEVILRIPAPLGRGVVNPLRLASGFWIYRAAILKDAQAMRWVVTTIMSNFMSSEKASRVGSQAPDAFGMGNKKCLPRKNPERHCVLRLQRQLGGKIEVSTPAGRIDLLTHRQILEVKHVKSWKAALGQVLAYASYYPHHGKRLHLFGKCDNDSKTTIEQCCAKQNVEVSWDS
jgi:hypothetical protein